MASGDHGFAAPGLYGTADDNTYSGALSFLRRRYTRDLTGVDVVVSGIAFLGLSDPTSYTWVAIAGAACAASWAPWSRPASPRTGRGAGRTGIRSRNRLTCRRLWPLRPAREASSLSTA